MIQRQQDEGFNKLRFRRGGSHRHDRFIGKDRRSFGNSPDIAVEGKILQIGEEFFIKDPFFPQKRDIFLIETEIFNIVDDLLQTGGNGESAAIGDLTEKHIEISDLVFPAVFIVTVGHGQFIIVAKHCIIIFLFHLHQTFLYHNIISHSTPFVKKSSVFSENKTNSPL